MIGKTEASNKHPGKESRSGLPLSVILIFQAIIMLFGIALLWMALPFHANAPKIGYVETNRMLASFGESRKNRAEIDSLNKDWQAKAKTLKDSLDGFMNVMGQTFNKASVQRQQEMRAEIEKRNQDLAQYIKASQKRVLEREKTLLEPTLKKINAFLQEFAERKKFDLIFGSTNNANILAGGHRLDLTDQVIRELNGKYP